MNIDEIISFINSEFSDEASDISAAIDLLVETLIHLNEQIEKSYSKYGNPNIYKDTFDRYRNNSLELYKLIDILNTYIENLTPDFDISESKDENNDKIEEALDLQDNSSEQQKIFKNLNIDYNDPKLNSDPTLPHTLYENFTHTKPCAFSICGEKIEVSQWRELLTKTCEFLYHLEGGQNKFEEFITSEDMNGDSRKYFSRNPNEIAEPQLIGGSDIYVIGNISATFTRNFIIRILNKFKIPKKDYSIFIQRDLSSLHIQDESVTKIEKDIESTNNIAIDSELKIGKYAREVLTNIFKSQISYAELKNMQDKNWSHETLGICYPLLKKYTKNIPEKQQRQYNNQNNRYYKNPIFVNNEKYFLCSQWFEDSRSKLDEWIKSRNDKNIVITHYYKIRNNTFSIIIEDKILKILLNAFREDIIINETLNVRRIRTRYENIIAQNTKYKTSPQNVIYCLVGKLSSLGVIKLAPNCQNGKYILVDSKQLETIIENPCCLDETAK